MAYPPGVQLATLTFSNPGTFLGNEADRTDTTVQATAGVVWSATGQPIDDFEEVVSPGNGMPGSLTVPFVDQEGFTDQAGNIFTNWAYIITRKTVFGNKVKTVKKNWQPIIGQDNVDFDNLPGGTIGLPVSAPQVPVTSVAGLTSAVGAEDLAGALGEFLPAPDVSGKLDVTALDAATAADITTPGTETATALNATIAAPRGGNYTDSPFPVFTKLPAPIFTEASTGYSTIYHPSVLRVDNILGSPLGKFYMWYSTDHKGIDGKIGLAYANSPEGPWTDHGTVWVDTTIGQETETPSVVWNPKENLFFMAYQMDWNGTPAAAGAVGAQSTLLATSPDGINWTRVGIIIDLAASADVPGNGHTGYARLHRLGSTWVALHLLGGGDYSHRGISYSRNGRNWVLDTRPIEPQTHFAGDSTSKTILYELFQWRGETWGIGTEGTLGSGVDGVVRHLVFGRVTPDMRHFAEVPERLIELDAAWETNNIRTVHVFTDKGKVYVIYQTDNNFGLAVAGA